MRMKEMFYLFLTCTSLALTAVLTLDKIETRAALWYDSYVGSMELCDRLDLYNGLNDLGVFSSYSIMGEKGLSEMAQLIALLDTATIEEEARILKALSFLINDVTTQFPIKIDYEARVETFYQKCEKNKQLKGALNAFFADLKSFMDEEGSGHSSLFVSQLQKTRVGVLNFAKILEKVQEQIQDKDTIVRTEFEDTLVPYYYECRKIVEEGIHQFMIEAVGIQRLLNELILFYMDTIIKKIDHNQ